MLKRNDLHKFISEVADNANSKVSVKIRANVGGVDTLKIASLIEDAGADYLHVDAMKIGAGADYGLLKNLVNQVSIPVIGNNSINNEPNLEKMLKTGVSGFSIARAIISGNLDFDILKY